MEGGSVIMQQQTTTTASLKRSPSGETTNTTKKRPRPDTAISSSATTVLSSSEATAATSCSAAATATTSTVNPILESSRASPPIANHESAAPTTTSTTSASVGTITPGESASSLPQKATLFCHLRGKYTGELDYMLREFQKLERQLLGAKGVTTESAGSRERREKLRSFIQHLEDTTQQIKAGCALEAAGKPTCPISGGRQQDNVMKLEDHILANLLPVKVRLKKQLAAQQGARQNPAGMPPVRGSAPTAFLKPRATAASSTLTQKLHPPNTTTTVAAPTTTTAPPKKILYGGMTPGSTQVKSSIEAASSVHRVVIKNPSLLELQTELQGLASANASLSSLEKTTQAFDFSEEEVQLSACAQAAILSYEKKRKMRRKRKRRRLLQQQAAAAAAAAALPNKRNLKAAGPRTVEYTCGLCNEVYGSTCECNPWWALTRQECQKCRKMQIPRVDISAAANAIEYHPALLAHADDNSGTATEAVVVLPPQPVPPQVDAPSDISDDDDDLLFSDDDESMFSSPSDSDDGGGGGTLLTPADQAEQENFGLEYEGPVLKEEEACRLLTLMLHASTCPCQHKTTQHQDVCRSVKWIMLHVRDCPGTTCTYDICPYPWCRKVKHLLYHLLSCTQPDECRICTTAQLGPNMSRLFGLNQHRAQHFRDRLLQKLGTKPSASLVPDPVASAAAKAESKPLSAQTPCCTEPSENAAPENQQPKALLKTPEEVTSSHSDDNRLVVMREERNHCSEAGRPSSLPVFEVKSG